ncbi:Peptidoglycan/LPS O-acetylase OafA/YrhL, contains acyltransferase and SGNH-hydrolase domains [Georgenia satyanarayanai]|uniref:Peptidoglycan/LPS O-acetylase OafA/YrhL, contains acyltransferase and SGNH-hydrolase domains n=1 Tax=Georgenia satyanarayanai TaxID=860221 RepID=A0A2Y9AFH8_9MICO|nr:acyltransferase family protein [Georgenia satyanarayanai]PYF99412.1 peptidoglycan/LPS O-acetylase OafA/YrhL [Georgenia satyanarayanai]SSA43224.1 Peptidoglycan/LPS O-acetylase OafA/YrhL, contains acyltransferase and SGNH-hydrolase domains [Georgenia satyanarayanai]
MTSTDTQMARPAPAARPSAFRPDIEGLRAVAIGLVLVYHAGVHQLPGGFVGVDVFFVISGFLITGLLIREIERDGRVSLRRFYARRAKRLLPAAGLVLVVTAALTLWALPVVDRRAFGWDIVGAALYVVNWVLAGRSVDYLAEDVGASPVQHFWSLAVEEQFYIVWPLLLVLVALLVRRHARLRVRPVMAVGILLIVVPSFLWSVHYSEASPNAAFFVTTTRLWELGIGAFVAIGATQWGRLPRAVATVLGWAGLATVVLSGLLLTSEVTWPGSAALLPTLGTAAVIVAGFVHGNRGPARLLAWKPAVWVGGLSYSLYLWHWPLIVAATALWGDLGGKRGLLVMAAAVVPAYLSYRFVENPIRFSGSVSRSDGLALSIGANFSLVGVAAGLALVLAVPITAPSAGAASGAAALEDGAGQTTGPGSLASLAEVEGFVPAPVDAPDDVPVGYADDCDVDVTEDDLVVCEYGNPDGDLTVAVIGDSKIFQWQSAIDAVAEEQGWRLVYLIKSACPFTAALPVAGGAVNDTCVTWNDDALATVADLQPDVVLTSQRSPFAPTSRETPDDRTTEAMEDGLVERWEELAELGIPVAVLLDNPAPPDLSVYECVAENLQSLEECAFDRETGIAESAALTQRAAAERVDTARVVDLTEHVCPAEECVPVIGDVLVYRQGSHLTDTYVRSLTPVLARELVPVVEELAGD